MEHAKTLLRTQRAASGFTAETKPAIGRTLPHPASHGGFDFPKLNIRDASEGQPLLQKKAAPNHTGLPDSLKMGVERLSGFPMDDVRVHYNSSRPGAVQSLAYTQGSEIHVAPGQERHLAHEAWHVAQQKQGRVSATSQINGLPLNSDSGLEREADVMGARAATTRTASPETENRGGGSRAASLPANPAIQRKGMRDVVVEQDRREAEIGDTKAEGRKYTTVGMEFDIAKLADRNILEGLTHIELAKSDFTWNNLNYNLETDAGNVLELVTPPFFVQTVPPEHLPSAADLNALIGALMEDLAGIVQEGKTLGDLTANAGWNAFGIGKWLWQELEAGWQNWSHRAKSEDEVAPALADKTTVPAIEIAKALKRLPQINIAATAGGYHAVIDSPLKPRVEASNIKSAFDATTTIFRQRIGGLTDKELSASSDEAQSDRIRNFMERMIVVLSQQHAVQYIEATAAQQKEGWSGNLDKAKKSKFSDIAGGASYVKDMQSVWLKTDLLSFGLSLLQPADWPIVRKLAADVRKKLGTKAIPLGKLPADTPHGFTLEKVQASMDTVLDNLLKKSAPLVTADNKAQAGAAHSKAAVALVKEISQTKTTGFNEHNPGILGVRQDTFIKPGVLAGLSGELGYARLLQVMEVRSAPLFLKWLEERQKPTADSSSGGKDAPPSSSGAGDPVVTPATKGKKASGATGAASSSSAPEAFARGQIAHWSASCYLNSVLQLMASSAQYRNLLDPAHNPKVGRDSADPDLALFGTIRRMLTDLRTPGRVISARGVEHLIDQLIEHGILIDVAAAEGKASKKVEEITKKEVAKTVEQATASATATVSAPAATLAATSSSSASPQSTAKPAPQPAQPSTSTASAPTTPAKPEPGVTTAPPSTSSKGKEKAEALPIEVRHQQQDAAEVLQGLLDRLLPAGGARANYMVTKRETLTRAADAPRHADVSDTILNLAITEHVNTLEDALLNNAGPENVDVRAPGENVDTVHTKTTIFTAMPEVLTISLKRFTYDVERQTPAKITRAVTAPTTLVIPQACLAPALRDEEYRYRLVSFVYHSGKSAQEGHYTPYARVPGAPGGHDTWESYDDITGYSKPKARLLNARRDKSYIYTYERIPNG